MAELWFAILGITLVFFTVMEGWDYGAGALAFRVARDEGERRQLIAAIGPLWTWHEVWLLAAAGVLLVAFPAAMTAAFSGFYLALFMVAWCLLLRGISLEFGGHVRDRIWRAWWDRVFALANILL